MTSSLLITGANGFLGRHISRVAASMNFHVIGLGHGDWTEDEWRSWGLSEWHELDVTVASLAAHANRPDVIVHCAGSGSVGFSFQNPAQDYDRTVGTTLDVLEYVRTSSPSTRVVYPSSAAVYGNVLTLPISEDSLLVPVSPYGVHKKIAEDLCRSFGRTFGLNIGLVRIFSAYGRELRKQLLWDACQKTRHGNHEFGGTGEETRDWVSAEDISNLLIIASEHAGPDVPVFNGSTGVQVATKDILSHLFNELNCWERPIFNGASRPGDPLRLAGDDTRAKSIGWEPRWNWRDGVSDYARWFMETSG